MKINNNLFTSVSSSNVDETRKNRELLINTTFNKKFNKKKKPFN